MQEDLGKILKFQQERMLLLANELDIDIKKVFENKNIPKTLENAIREKVYKTNFF